MKNVYAILDLEVGIYLTPIVEDSEPAAIRNFENAILNSTGVLHTHPQDFDLMFLGEYDDSEGIFLQDKPFKVITGLDVKVRYRL